MEPLRDWYVTFFGGRSTELRQGQIGINRENLEKTRLTPYVDRVFIRRLSETKRIPFYVRESYEVIPLDEETPDALSKSPRGEAVLPEEYLTARALLTEELRLKEPLILNNVLSRAFMAAPGDVARILATSYILKRGGLR